MGPLNAQSNPPWHVQSPIFPHTCAHNTLLWRYCTKCIFFYWSSGWKYGSSTQVVQQCSSRIEPPSLNNSISFADTGSWERSENVRHGKNWEKCLCPRWSQVSDGKTANVEWCCTKQTWQNIPSECRHWYWNSCKKLKKCAVRRSSWKKQRIKKFEFFYIKAAKAATQEKIPKNFTCSFSNYLESFLINIYYCFLVDWEISCLVIPILQLNLWSLRCHVQHWCWWEPELPFSSLTRASTNSSDVIRKRNLRRNKLWLADEQPLSCRVMPK